MVKVVKEWGTLTPREKVRITLERMGTHEGLDYGAAPHQTSLDTVLWYHLFAVSTGGTVARLDEKGDGAVVRLVNESYRSQVLRYLAVVEKLAGVEITLVVKE